MLSQRAVVKQSASLRRFAAEDAFVNMTMVLVKIYTGILNGQRHTPCRQ